MTLEGGLFGSRRHLNVQGRSANLPAITEKDWEDLQFGVDEGVDYFALSFVRDAQVHRLYPAPQTKLVCAQLDPRYETLQAPRFAESNRETPQTPWSYASR